MQANPNIGSMDAVLDELYGKVGSPEREEFRKEAYSYCVGQMISDVRKQEKMTQSELAEKVGTNKTYISRIEKGVVEPGVGLFFRIIDALGLKIEIVKPAYCKAGAENRRFPQILLFVFCNHCHHSSFNTL